MALDTREKRMNAARVARPWMRARHAVGATDEQSRIASGHGYGGNALSPGPVAATLAPVLAISYFESQAPASYFEPPAAPETFEPQAQPGERF